MRRVLKTAAILVCLLSCSFPALGQTPIRYIYDELGRLVSVIDANGDAATYNYDAVGNLTSITRTASGSVAIFEFTPNGAPIGASVTLYGIGYSPTPGLNSVTINGTAATVTSATATQVAITVPIGATSGTLAITTPNGSASASTPFTVGGPAAPTISGFSPAIATPGTAMTVTGTGFDTTLANNKLSVNLTYGAPSSITATQVSANVPTGGTSGRLTVATPYGTAVSTGDLFVPPSPFVASDVVTTDRLVIGTNKTVSVGTASKIGLVVFDMAAGQRASVQMTGVTATLSTITVRDPYAQSVGTASITTSGGFIEPFRAPAAGSYTVTIDPSSTYTGNYTLRAHDVPADVSGTIMPGGASVPFTISAPGQNARWTFSGTSGQRVSFLVTGSTLSLVTHAIVGPTTPTPVLTTTSLYGDVVTLPTTGTYTFTADPWGTATGSATITLYDVPPDASGTIPTNGTSTTVTTTVPGQNGALTFSGTSGQRVALVIPGGSPTASVTIRKPDGSTLASGSTGVFTSTLEPPLLPVTGTYTIHVDYFNHLTGTVTLALYDVPADVSGSIATNGTDHSMTITTPGQNGAYTFAGTAGQRVSLYYSSGPGGTVSVRRANGTVLASGSFGIFAGFIEPITLPANETYSVVVDLSGANTGTVTLRLYDVPADVTGSIAVNGSALGVTLTAPGQKASITFSGTSAQQVTVRLTNNTTGTTLVKVLKPDTTQLTATTSGSTNFNLTQQTLPTTGTYTIVIDPNTTGTGSITVAVTNP